MKTIVLLSIFFYLAASRNYPMYKQCDPAWGTDQLGTSSKTICQAGCAISSVSMALSGIGKSFNPKTLNQWLKAHAGYVGGDNLVWASVAPLGLAFQGKLANNKIKSKLDAGNVVICNVNNGAHWVLATGYNGDNILVNDPNHPVSSYAISTIVEGNNAVYRVGNPSFFQGLMESIKSLINNGNTTALKETTQKSILEGQILIS